MAHLDTLNRLGIRASIRRGNLLWLDPQHLVTSDVAETVRSHRDDLLAEIRACAISALEENAEIVPDYHFLWVATDLDSFEEFDPRFGYEIGGEPVYRMLDASYYAWLRHRMINAKSAHDAGHLDSTGFNTLRERFNIIHDWAVRHIGDDALRQAIRTTNVKTYIPPSEQTFAAYRKTWDDAWEAYQRRNMQFRSAQSDQTRRLEHAISTRGYAGVSSAIIGDIVVFVRDDSVCVPAKWSDKVRFTMDELSLMIGSSPEAVKQIHEVKRVFGGTVVSAGDDPFTGSAPMPRPVSVSEGQQSLFVTPTPAGAR